MSARRQSSTTSLSRFARANSPDLLDRSFDFCNAFWGAGDGGVDVLFARMRGAARTIDELRSFWKERASIEEDYAKRLAKLAKQTLGKDEIGELRNSLDTLRLETDRQAMAHANLAQQVRTELESPAGAFAARQGQFKRGAQVIIEKAFKNKQTQESYVDKAREKYEADCMRINSYTAQSSLVQGKDLEKIQMKLERARQTVTANERDFANFARALQGTVEKWEKDWKAFCDACQDLEEERIEFMKDNMWAYANAVSTVCVSDDESCEKIRLALEQVEPERDMENFVRDYGTGSEIPDPPKFVSYTNSESVAAASAKTMPRYASFPRASTRQLSMGEVMRNLPQEEEEPPDAGMAGLGAPARNGDIEIDRSNASAAQSRPVSTTNPANGTNGPTALSQTGGPSTPADPSAQKTILAVGGGVYEVYPEKDPQNSFGTTTTGSGSATGSGAGQGSSRIGGGDDPLLKQMAELRSSAAATGSVRRNSINVQQQRPGSGYQTTSPAPSIGPAPVASGPSGSALAAPAPATARPVNRDYRNSAEFVVGGPPPGSTSRPTSPGGPIVAAHWIPPAQVSSSSLPVEEVLSNYAPSLPGERRTPISRGNSPKLGSTHSHSQSLGQNVNQRSSIERPRSREGFAGIGAGGRSPSPRPAPGPSSSIGGYSEVNSNQMLTQNQNTYRLPSPGTGPDLGISLDASGQVTHDLMAEQYRQPTQQQAPPPPQTQPVRNQYGPPQRATSVQMTSTVNVGPPPPPQQPPQQPQFTGYGNHQTHVQPRQPTYPQAPPPPPAQNTTTGVQRQHSVWYPPAQHQPPVQHQPPPQQQPPQQYIPPPPQQVQPQPPINTYAATQNGANLHRGASMGAQTASGYGANANGSHWNSPGYADYNPAPHQNQNQYPYQQLQHAPPVRRSPSPQPPPNVGPAPTGQYINGRPILFYVKALYDYQATIDEEFDFQSGDIIAVTSTPEDGWWTGELLDDSRRIPGRTVFPSNFVCLF